MSQKQVKGRRKDGNGVQSSVRHGENDGNDIWDGFKKKLLECENEECTVGMGVNEGTRWLERE